MPIFSQDHGRSIFWFEVLTSRLILPNSHSQNLKDPHAHLISKKKYSGLYHTTSAPNFWASGKCDKSVTNFSTRTEVWQNHFQPVIDTLWRHCRSDASKKRHILFGTDRSIILTVQYNRFSPQKYTHSTGCCSFFVIWSGQDNCTSTHEDAHVLVERHGEMVCLGLPSKFWCGDAHQFLPRWKCARRSLNTC